MTLGDSQWLLSTFLTPLLVIRSLSSFGIFFGDIFLEFFYTFQVKWGKNFSTEPSHCKINQHITLVNFFFTLSLSSCFLISLFPWFVHFKTVVLCLFTSFFFLYFVLFYKIVSVFLVLLKVNNGESPLWGPGSSGCRDERMGDRSPNDFYGGSTVGKFVSDGTGSESKVIRTLSKRRDERHQKERKEWWKRPLVHHSVYALIFPLILNKVDFNGVVNTCNKGNYIWLDTQ